MVTFPLFVIKLPSGWLRKFTRGTVSHKTGAKTERERFCKRPTFDGKIISYCAASGDGLKGWNVRDTHNEEADRFRFHHHSCVLRMANQRMKERRSYLRCRLSCYPLWVDINNRRLGCNTTRPTPNLRQSAVSVCGVRAHR